jgi:hypothetical protein
MCGLRDNWAAMRVIVFRRQQTLHACRILGAAWYHRRVVDNGSAMAVARKLEVGVRVIAKEAAIYGARSVIHCDYLTSSGE